MYLFLFRILSDRLKPKLSGSNENFESVSDANPPINYDVRNNKKSSGVLKQKSSGIRKSSTKSKSLRAESLK